MKPAQQDCFDGIYDDPATRQRVIWQNGKPGPTCQARVKLHVSR